MEKDQCEKLLTPWRMKVEGNTQNFPCLGPWLGPPADPITSPLWRECQGNPTPFLLFFSERARWCPAQLGQGPEPRSTRRRLITLLHCSKINSIINYSNCSNLPDAAAPISGPGGWQRFGSCDESSNPPHMDPSLKKGQNYTGFVFWMIHMAASLFSFLGLDSEAFWILSAFRLFFF